MLLRASKVSRSTAIAPVALRFKIYKFHVSVVSAANRSNYLLTIIYKDCVVTGKHSAGRNCDIPTYTHAYKVNIEEDLSSHLDYVIV